MCHASLHRREFSIVLFAGSGGLAIRRLSDVTPDPCLLTAHQQHQSTWTSEEHVALWVTWALAGHHPSTYRAKHDSVMKPKSNTLTSTRVPRA